MEPYEEDVAVEKNKNKTKDVYDWVEALVSALVTVILLFTFCFRIVGVEGSSWCTCTTKRGHLTVHCYSQDGDIVVINKAN
jgi:signal peptidase I